MVIEALPDDLSTTHNNAPMAIVKGRQGRLLQAQSETTVSLHLANGMIPVGQTFPGRG
jgi:hypothetical protein